MGLLDFVQQHRKAVGGRHGTDAVGGVGHGDAGVLSAGNVE